MKKSLAAITISSCILFGCSNPNDSGSKANDSSAAVLNVTSDSSTEQSAPTPADTLMQVPTGNAGAITAPIPAPALVAQPVVKTAPGMNPPHGEPGHRCDIAVGAPLNSPPGGNAANQGLKVPPPASPTAPGTGTSSSTVTTPGMNPPHGEPGHDCAVAVGAPLPQK